MLRRHRADTPREPFPLLKPRPLFTFGIRFRIGAAVALLLAMTPGQSASQDCTQDCTAILEAALQALTERLEVPLSRVIVDITEPGRASVLGSRVGPPLPLSIDHVVASSQRLGFRTASEAEFHACFHPGRQEVPLPSFCDRASVSVGIVPFAPEVRGDSASIYLTYHLDRPERAILTAGGIQVDLLRDGREWKVKNLRVLAQGHRRR